MLMQSVGIHTTIQKAEKKILQIHISFNMKILVTGKSYNVNLKIKS